MSEGSSRIEALADALWDSDDESLRNLPPFVEAGPDDEEFPFPLSELLPPSTTAAAAARAPTGRFAAVASASERRVAEETPRPTGRLATVAYGPMRRAPQRVSGRVAAGGPAGLPAERQRLTTSATAVLPVNPVWVSGEWMVCPESCGPVCHVAESRLVSAMKRGGVKRGPEMVWHFPLAGPSGVEWTVLCESAVTMVQHVLHGGPTIFKIGLTRDPLHRWGNRAYGYNQEGFSRMIILCATVPAWAAALEAHLIGIFRGVPGCRNTAPGGESTPSHPPVFVYVVSVLSDDYVSWSLARARAQRQ